MPLPDSPVDLIHLFCPEFLVEKWVTWTNTHVETILKASGANAKNADILQWRPLTVANLYIWLATLIYVGNNPCERLADYWVTSVPGKITPNHFVAKFITFRQFALISRYIRTFPPSDEPGNNESENDEPGNDEPENGEPENGEPENEVERMISCVQEWGDLIQAVSTQLLLPGTNLSVDEIVILKGRSLEGTNKSGLKILAAAEKGYLLRWEYYIPRAAQTPARRREHSHSFAEKQRLVLDLAGVDHGVYRDLVIAKQADREGRLQWGFDSLRAVPSEDDLVNHTAFKDKCIVLWMTSFSGSETAQHLRSRPNTTQAQAREARVFGLDYERMVDTPSIKIAYNFNMNGVDRGDQLRAHRGCGQRRNRHGGWHALAWTFLLDTILVNTYILQQKGQCSWGTYRSQADWRDTLTEALMRKYASASTLRRRFRSGNEFLPISQHKHVKGDNNGRSCEALLMRLRDYSKGTDGPEIEDWDADQTKTDSAQTWSVKVRALESDNAPLYRLYKILDAVKTKLQSGHGSGLQKVKAALKWPFDEKEVAKLVDAFQGERSLLHFAMTHESTQLVQHIKATSDDNSRQLTDLVRLIKNKSADDELRVAQLDRILTGIQLSNLKIAEGIGHLQNSQMSAHQKEVLDWIRQEPGTGEWLLESDEYNTWVKGDKQTLFCPGIPGAGKMIMASIVVNSLLESFHSESNIELHTSTLSENQPSLFEPVEELYNKRKASRTRPSLHELGRVLQEVAATYSRVYIVLDALDECETTDGTLPNFIQQVLELQCATGTNILATSRYIPEIKEKFRKAVSLKIRAIFVQNKPELQEEIKTRILESVQGMFILAQLHLDSLVGKRSPKAVRTILKALPSSSSTSKAYDKAYGDAMKRIEDQLTDQAILAKEALMWISCARRLLSPVELQHALGIEIDSTDFDEENLSEIPDIVSACAGLVTVDEQSNTVRLAHFTTQEYFERTQDQWFPNAAQEITVKTLTYLSYDLIVDQVRTARSPKPDITVQRAAENSDTVIDQSKYEKPGSPSPGLGRSKSQDWKIKNEVTESDEDYDVKKMLRDYPLCRYASCHWGYHARNVSEMPDIVKNFLSSETLVKRCSIDALDSYNVSILEMACGLGHLSLAETLLKKGANLRGTPITYAARRGQDAIVTYLFQYGAPLEPGALEAGFRHFKDSKISVDKVPMFQTLLEHGADPNILIDETSRPLHHATSDKVEPLVRILLDHAADVNGRDKEGRTALHLAVDSEMESLVRLLVDRGAEVNPQDDQGHTPLYHTVGRDIDPIVRLLLDHGANAILQDKHGLSVPHLAMASSV
ncbi:heterokaryon incompatibility protein het-E-1 [Fusarium napiforme]|uniref:Heterokaryon incompatibility protein het-E-1 n=1 Tax=Fusarium napiforme TaxID=42672 RepID=A0A8H5IK43_9HYPO|nr:heterokaryon incompatibility protein het-E-1 [Fusarium napiforme]